MGVLLSSPHVHTRWCDGKSTAEETVRSALEKGFVSIGFSSHAVQHFDPDYCVAFEHEQDYIDEVRAVQRKYAGRIRVWLGMERDSHSPADRTRYEYVLASVHYLQHEGKYYAVDGLPEDVRRYVQDACRGDGAQMAVRYYDVLGAYIESYKPDIIGHFDLVMKNNRDGLLFDPDDPRVAKAAHQAMDRAFAGCRVMEVNTGAVVRSKGGAPYPSLKLLRRWRQMGGQVILASDCHLAAQIDAGYQQGLQLMREAGYKHMLLLGRGAELFETGAITEI